MVDFIGLKVPPNLRLSVVVGKNLGDTPVVTITNPRNLKNPTAVKTGTNQYELMFDAGCAGETVNVTMAATGRWAFLNFFTGFLKLFTLTFWMNLIPGRGFWTTFSWKTFMMRSLMVSGMLFMLLVVLELSGVTIHKRYLNWLNTMDMVSDAVYKIKGITGLDDTDPFFKGSEAQRFYTRTGKKLQDAYLMTSVSEEDESYRLLISKEFYIASELDDAEDHCANEIGGEIPTLKDYYLMMKESSLTDQMMFAFAEWINYPYGIVSDDYMLWVMPINVQTYEAALQAINNGSADSLMDMAENYSIDKNGLTDEEFKTRLLVAVKNELRLPLEADITSKDGQTIFYLDEDEHANYRCVRKLPMLK